MADGSGGAPTVAHLHNTTNFMQIPITDLLKQGAATSFGRGRQISEARKPSKLSWSVSQERQYVDMVGIDIYEFDNDDAAYQQNLSASLDVMMAAAKKVGKIPALTETGCRGISQKKDWFTQDPLACTSEVSGKLCALLAQCLGQASGRSLPAWSRRWRHRKATSRLSRQRRKVLFVKDIVKVKKVKIEYIMTTFQEKVKALRAHHEELLSRKNEPVEWGNGIYEKYKNPILTAEHTPLEWRYDFDEKSNPYLMQRIMMNATLNSGAIKWNGKYLLVVRVEGADRKSFFAVAESPNGIDNFRFWDEPITMPEDVIPATNIYDMRLTAHEDGYIYGVFCAERHDDAPAWRSECCYCYCSYCTYQGLGKLGASSRPEDQESAA